MYPRRCRWWWFTSGDKRLTEPGGGGFWQYWRRQTLHRQFQSLILSLSNIFSPARDKRPMEIGSPWLPPGRSSQHTFFTSGEKRLHPKNKTTINRVVSALCFGAVAAASFWAWQRWVLDRKYYFFLLDVCIFSLVSLKVLTHNSTSFFHFSLCCD